MIERVVEVEDFVEGMSALCPVTNMFDSQGNDTDDPLKAVTFVAQLDDEAFLSLHCSRHTIHVIQ